MPRRWAWVPTAQGGGGEGDLADSSVGRPTACGSRGWGPVPGREGLA